VASLLAIISFATGIVRLRDVVRWFRPSDRNPILTGVSDDDRISVLQRALSSEKARREDQENLYSQKIAQLTDTAAQVERDQNEINALQIKLTDAQTAFDNEHQTRIAAESKLMAFKAAADSLSAQSAARTARMKDDFMAGRKLNVPAPDGSNRYATLVWDSAYIDVIPQKIAKELKAEGY
jgi:hypothetical protein